MSTPGWDWRNVYWWSAGYEFVAPAQYGNDKPWGGELFLEPGVAYPVGYRVPDGSVGGVEPAPNKRTQGDEQIKLQPPTSGSGPCKFISHMQIWVENSSRHVEGSFAFAIGVCDVSPGDMPMWPFIGAGHYLEMEHVPSQTVEPGGVVLASMVRIGPDGRAVHVKPAYSDLAKLGAAAQPRFKALSGRMSDISE